jgi:hypothetical protein
MASRNRLLPLWGSHLRNTRAGIYTWWEVEFLGRVVGPRGMHIGPGYIKDIEDWPRPKNKKEVERFLGFTNYHLLKNTLRWHFPFRP